MIALTFFILYYWYWNLTTSFLIQIERVMTIIQNPRQYKIPDWFLNRQKDIKDGKYSQVTSLNYM